MDRAKRALEVNHQIELKELMKHLKHWWKGLKKLKVGDKRITRSDVLKVRDIKGEVKEGEEAVMMWNLCMVCSVYIATVKFTL